MHRYQSISFSPKAATRLGKKFVAGCNGTEDSRET
jgi:hypothetical protein